MGHPPFADFERGKCSISFQQINVRLRVVADASNQLELIRQLDDVIICAEVKGTGFDNRIFGGRED